MTEQGMIEGGMTAESVTVAGGQTEAFEFPILVGDIGGTNARFAVVEHAGAATGEPQIVHTADFATIDDAIRAAVLERLGVQPRSALLAIAGPVIGDEIPLTNCPWVVKPKGMAATVGLMDVMVLNDFEAQALAVVALGDHHLEKIGGGEPLPHAGRAVLGPGTGLGVAGLLRSDGKWIPVAGEGGHMDIGPRTPRDYQVWPHIEPLEGRVSGEQILSGRGLVNTYRAVALADGKTPVFTTPAEVTKAALEKSDPVAEEALCALCHLPRPDGRRRGAGVQGARRRLSRRRHRAEDHPGAESRQFPRRLQRQGAAQRMDGRNTGLCDHRSARRAGRACSLCARAAHIRRRDRRPPLAQLTAGKEQL